MPERSARRHVIAAAVVCALLAALWAPAVSMRLAWGWDETMHAELAALRLCIAASDGDAGLFARAVHDCEQYPFGWPALLALVQLVIGPSELAARVTGRCLWAVGLFGLFLLAREVAWRTAASAPPDRAGSDARGAAILPWIALALGAASPLALCYSGTLFLEIPFVVTSIYALRAWLRRAHDAPIARELVAGALVAAAFFVKFNYGLMLGFGLFLDLCCEAFVEVRAGRARTFARRTAWLALVPVLSFAWWFVLPLPFGSDVAASHRAALVAWLGGNTSATMATPWSIRAMHWGSFLAWSPRVLLVMLAGAALTLPRAREPAVRALWLVALASAVPVALHPFHLDRFLLPGAVLVWTLAAAGIAWRLPARAAVRAGVLAGIAIGASVRPDVDGMWLVRAVGLANPELRQYQLDALARLGDLSGDRALETNGLERETLDALLDLYAREIRADDRVGWVGNSHIVSPLAVHAGLWMRGGPGRARIAAGRFEDDFVAIGNDDPHWSDEQFLAWAARFTVLLTTDPVDMTENPNRRWLAQYQQRIEASGRWSKTRLGSIAIARPLRDPIRVEVYAMRPLR